jgi:hypothetical protein
MPAIFAASVAGPGHVRAGVGCQDAHGWRQLADGSVVLAVADGAGSARLAADGARAAVAGALAGTSVPTALSSARGAVESLAGGRSVHPRELACTLLVCLWSHAGTVTGHIGDGACVAWVGEPPQWVLLSPPAPSEYTNETRFLTDSDWQRQIRLSHVAGCVEAVVLMTDGCQRAALHRTAQTWEPYPPFLTPILSYIRRVESQSEGTGELKALLTSPKLANHSDDDKTILILRSDGRASVRSGWDAG